MSPWRDEEGDMRPTDLDDDTVDRLLAGRILPDDAPPGYATLAQALADVRQPADESELAGRDLIVAAVVSALTSATEPVVLDGPGHSPTRRRPMLFRKLGVKVAAATMTTALAATGAAAATGSLPDAAQVKVSDVVDAIGVDIPRPDRAGIAEGKADRAEGKADRAEAEADRAEGRGGDADRSDAGDENRSEVADLRERQNDRKADLNADFKSEREELRADDDTTKEDWQDLREDHKERRDALQDKRKAQFSRLHDDLAEDRADDTPRDQRADRADQAQDQADARDEPKADVEDGKAESDDARAEAEERQAGRGNAGK